MISLIHRLKWFVGLVLLQALVLNQMHIGGYATPFLYIYFILKFDSRVGRNELMLWSFALGLAVDTLGNTPGMNAAAATCLAFFRMPMLRLVTLRDVEEGFRPGTDSMGMSAFMRYAWMACILFCTVLWLIDDFSIRHILHLIFKIFTSTLSTMLCVICIESLGRKKA
jgi:rod shape-determining protein MreD